MSLASLKATFKALFNSPEGEVERRIGEDERNDDMCIAKGVTANICLNAHKDGIKFVRLKESGIDVADVFHVTDSGDERCGYLPLEQAIYLARRIRVLANIDGWGHLDTTPNQMEVLANGEKFNLIVNQFELSPVLNVLFEVKHVGSV